MAMTVLSAILGLFSPLAFMLGASSFEVRGGTPLKRHWPDPSQWLFTSRFASSWWRAAPIPLVALVPYGHRILSQ